jgi:cellulose synthase/poly-beta-1,6-N-acetylglucosamine synthase-like glycosyltransferase
MIIAWSILACCITLILHTYVFYPSLVNFLKRFKSNGKAYSPSSFNVAVLIAAFNEEQIIKEKLLSVLNNIPSNVNLDVYVGSDASTDSTNDIVKDLQLKFDNVHLVNFEGRTGKAMIINKLAENCDHDILILTDANVLFHRDTISELLLPFEDNTIKMVCANILKRSKSESSFENIEKSYIDRENRIKLAESELWDLVMGAEGGCYAIRSSAYNPVPKNFFMDDFFMTMQVLEKGGKVVFRENAVCFEDIPDKAFEEFKRKIRISIGNFQNLVRFRKLLFPIWSKVAFAFWSHKLLRWFTPFFLVLSFVSSVVLSTYYSFMIVFVLIQVILFLSPLLSFFKVNSRITNMIIHFYYMNLALLIGFIKFLIGVKSSVWTPTLRNIQDNH